MSDLISIIVVDDHPLFREGVVMSLIESGKFDVVAPVSYTHLTLPTIYSV